MPKQQIYETNRRPTMRQMIKLDDIDIPASHRPLDKARAERLADAIREDGELLHPIGVCKSEWPDRYLLVHGLHRMAAFNLLGRTHILASIFFDMSPAQAELCELDENLARAGLTALEESKALARRQQLYEALHPEAKHGGKRKPKKDSRGAAETLRTETTTLAEHKATKGQDAKMASCSPPPAVPGTAAETRDAGSRKPSFAKDTAAKTGKSARTIQRKAQIGREIPDDWVPIVAKVPQLANSASELAAFIKLIKADPAQARTVAQMIADGEVATVAEAIAEPELPEEPADQASDALRRALARVKDGWRRECGPAATAPLGAAVLEAVAAEWLTENWGRAKGKK